MKSNAVTSERLADVAGLRQSTYLLFGSLFHYPRKEQLEELVVAAQEMRHEDDLARDFSFYRSWNEVLGSLAHLTEEEKKQLQEEYIDLFQLAGDSTPCSLYESSYVDRTGRMTGWIVSQVERSYSAGGFALSKSAGGELPDHAGLELEFMSLLCAKEAQGWGSDHTDEVAESLALQKTFLDQHLHRWFPSLARQVGRVADQESFYKQLAEATRAFVIHDRDLVEAIMEASNMLKEENPPDGE